MNPNIVDQLKALAGPEQKYCADTAAAHAGLFEVHESMEMELCNAIYDTIIKESYKTVIEVGRHYGCSTAWILAAINKTRGSLLSIDVQEWERDICREVDLDTTRLICQIWPLIQEGDVQRHWYMQSECVKKLPKKADFIIVDAAHNVDETTALATLFTPLIRKGGQIAFHDNYSYRRAVNVPLVKYFSDPQRESKWLTCEVPIGCGMFVAKRI